MIRFAMYVLLTVSGGLGLWLLVASRGRATPRALAKGPVLALTVVYGLYMAGRTVAFWLTGAWWQEPPVAAWLAMMGNGVILAWTLTEIVVLMDRVREHRG